MLKRYLTEKEQRELLAKVRGCSSLLARRDHAWIRLLIETGMRVNELATLHLEQAKLALQTGWMVVRADQRKGRRKPHDYLVTAPVRDCLEVLVAVHADLAPALVVTDEPPLIWGRCGWAHGELRCDHISVRSLQVRLQHWAELAGLPGGVSPHWLRHTRGVNIIRRSRGQNPLKVAQLALGHATIASTGIYTQMSREEYAAELHAVAGGRMRRADARALAGVGL